MFEFGAAESRDDRTTKHSRAGEKKHVYEI